MCNACGNYCCGSDEFGRCGCEDCPNPACWPEDDEDRQQFPDPDPDDIVVFSRPRFFCESIEKEQNA